MCGKDEALENQRGHGKLRAIRSNAGRIIFSALDDFVTDDNALFRQDGATSHTSRISMDLLRLAFPDRLISRNGDIPWPARSPDLTSPDFFLWDFLKSKVFHSSPPRTL